MNHLKTSCFICQAALSQGHTKDYLACSNCGHEVLDSSSKQGFIINDDLSILEIRKVTSLDRFKQRVLTFFDRDLIKNHLLDIGSASGKFVFQCKKHYTKVTGIEITKESVNFSRNILNLNIIADIDELEEEVNIATAWHSLEHIPEKILLHTIEGLSKAIECNGALIVSVPNVMSYQYRALGKFYAFYDVPNHLHQFSPQSLDILMKKYGFIHVKTVNSWTYNLFGWTQGLLNVLTNSHNYLYYRLKRKSQRPVFASDVIHGFLLIICTPLAWILTAIEYLSPTKQGVITSCYQNRS